MRRTLLAWLLLLPLLAGCNWRALLGVRKSPPPPLAPGAVAQPNTDPILQMQKAIGVPMQTVTGPTLPTGHQLVFYRYAKGNQCVQGFVAYNQNRTVQSRSEGTIACDPTALVSLVGTGTAGDYTVLYGFVESSDITRVDVALPDGTTETSQVHDASFYFMQPTPGSSLKATTGMSLVGYDAIGKELYRRTEP